MPPAATTLTLQDLPSPARRALGGGAGGADGAGGTGGMGDTGGAVGGAASDWQDWCCASLLRMVGAELLIEMLSAAAQALLTMALLTMAILTMDEVLSAAAQGDHCRCSILTMAILTMTGGVTAAARRRVARPHGRRRRACGAPRALPVAGRLPTRTSAEDA